MPYSTHHKHKGTHHCVWIYVLSDYSCHCMPYYTHHKHMGSHNCVYYYGLSDCSCNYMPYYTHHKYNGAPHCVCVYALSEHTCHCMPYYTHHKHKVAQHYAIIDVLSECCLTECLIIYFTVIKVLPTMYVFMVYQTTLVTECLITHNIHKGAQHCVCIYGLSDYSCHCLPYYTRHT